VRYLSGPRLTCNRFLGKTFRRRKVSSIIICYDTGETRAERVSSNDVTGTMFSPSDAGGDRRLNRQKKNGR